MFYIEQDLLHYNHRLIDLTFDETYVKRSDSINDDGDLKVPGDKYGTTIFFTDNVNYNWIYIHSNMWRVLTLQEPPSFTQNNQ